ncbi:carboxypeptidase-like regulatory domain-containing protein [uncultured Polaribacter sp.]|uniref:TonB-dependent receptor n=1 Tax=uncultured Polaribacter sp. TaxID=174711 RepID=UPI0026217F9F|nr:carboxypeptidase-like regulatory domain-containing protein [uncultured Polaribacter sp.]
MKNFKNLLFIALFFVTATILGQTRITGTVVDESSQPLPGASVLVKGTTIGINTDFDGKFTLKSTSNSGVLVISYIGYKSKEVSFTSSNFVLGSIQLDVDADSLDEIVIVGKGVIDLAGGRKTPIAVSTIKAAEIQKKIGTQDVTMALVNTPSIYVAGQSGGFGDSRISVRGFDQTNTAFLLNGQPINGMEDGKMYWSNWTGVNDIATAVQIQRGLGASKLAISSVGGTMNFVTKTTDKNEGGYFYSGTANDNFYKVTASYNTGVKENGWGASVMLSHWQGDGYNEGNKGQGQTYFISFGYKPNDNNNFNFLITGAPQWHDQNYTKSLSNYATYGNKYNSNWGTYNGEYMTERRNFYHKPVLNLNWDYTISDASTLSTVLYASFGTGGGTGNRGSRVRTDEGRIDYDAIYANNAASGGAGTWGNDTYITRASMNNHAWYGVVSSFEHELNENLTWNIGADLRTYYGTHFRQVENFHGLTSWTEDRTLKDNTHNRVGATVEVTATESFNANPWETMFSSAGEDQRIDYDSSERISYGGIFTQLEYSDEIISAFFQGSISSQNHQRFDRYDYEAEHQDSEKVNNIGYNLKIGAGFKLSEISNVYMNTGYYSRQPYHDNIFNNYDNSINPVSQNEKIFGLEMGYNLKTEFFSANLNLYSTSWRDRVDGATDVDATTGAIEITQTTGQSQYHKGVELDFIANISSNFKLKGFVSAGDWEYVGEVTSVTLDEDRNIIGASSSVDVDGGKVGDAAQFTAGLGFDYQIVDNFSIDSDYRFYDQLYANVGAVKDNLELPSFGLLDVGASFKLNLGEDKSKSLNFRANVNNVLNKEYISELSSNIATTSASDTYLGVDASNRGFIGLGTTWNFSVRYNF